MQGQHLDYLDGWRGLAIAFVLVGHFFPVPGLNMGAVGVDFFFALSGLFMARLLFVQKVPLTLFYRRRISRILPAAATFLGTVVAFMLLRGLAVDWHETAAAALFVNNYFPGEPGNAHMPFGHVWSLSVEEHSYVLLAVLAAASRRSRLRPVLLTVACALACAGATLYYGTRPDLGPFRWLRTEVAGYGIFVSASLAIVLHRRLPARLPWPVVPALVAFGAACHWWSVPEPVRVIAGMGAFAAAVNLLAATPAPVRALLAWAPLRWLGLLSFSIYLWQQPFYLLFHRAGWHPALALAAALACAVASYVAVEKPARQWLNRHWAREPARPAAAQDEERARVGA